MAKLRIIGVLLVSGSFSRGGFFPHSGITREIRRTYTTAPGVPNDRLAAAPPSGTIAVHPAGGRRMSAATIRHPHEPAGNADREAAARVEPRSLRTFTPTQAVLARSAGVYHWTPDGRRLFDFTSGVLVSNLGHNPTAWTERFFRYMGWTERAGGPGVPAGYFAAVPMTAYNAVTPIEAEASRRLLAALRRCPGGGRMETVMWAASGSEAIQKALWAAMARDRTRPMIVATRFGFHGKKGLACAVTGSEHDAERDPRVRFVSFPMRECRDVALRDEPFDPAPYRAELDALWHQFGPRLGTLITEPYLGGGGSYHPPAAYLQLLARFCREKDLVFILDEVQANFGRTGALFAFENYGVEPDIVVLGKGLGNGVPVAAAVGRADVFGSLDYGEGSDTWSANPLNAAAVLATLDEFEGRDVLGQMKEPSRVIEAGLVGLKRLPFVAAVRGERGGMVWGVEFADHAGRSAAEWANAFVLACYRGDGTATADGVHLLGPLAKKVVRISPPLTITPDEAAAAMRLIDRAAAGLAEGGR
jgi:4-aminobutyrate aminotransferase-like enzyme